MTVKELKQKLQRALNNLDRYEDEQEVEMVSNTYFLGDCSTFLGISGFDGGYINLNQIQVYDDDDDCEEEE